MACLIPIAATAAVFLILPPLMPDNLSLFLLMIVNPAVCLLASALFGICAGLSRWSIVMPLACGMFFILSMAFFHSSAELVYLAVYLGASVLGIGAGWLLSQRG